MQQKCDAWREEVKKLSPLRDEVAQLHQENARLEQELAQVTEDITKLKRELQEMSNARQKVSDGSMHCQVMQYCMHACMERRGGCFEECVWLPRSVALHDSNLS